MHVIYLSIWFILKCDWQHRMCRTRQDKVYILTQKMRGGLNYVQDRRLPRCPGFIQKVLRTETLLDSYFSTFFLLRTCCFAWDFHWCCINSKVFRFHGCTYIERMKQLSRYVGSVLILAQSGYLMQAVCHRVSGNGKAIFIFF